MTPPRALVDPPPVDPPRLPSQHLAVEPLAAFPSDLEFALSTTDQMEDDIQIDRAVDGTGRARTFYATPKHRIAAGLTALTSQEFLTFDAFYRANRVAPFTIPWGECGSHVALSVMFAAPPARSFHGRGLSSVSFTLVEFP